MIRRTAVAVLGVVVLLGATVGILIMTGGHAATPAQTQIVTRGAGLANLKVTPVRVTLPTAARRTQVRFSLVNQGKQIQQVSVSAAEVSPATAARLPDSRTAANRWVQLSHTALTISPAGKATVTATISPPASREPGERRVEVYFRAAPTAGGGQLSFALSLGASIWIPGPGIPDRSIVVSAVRAPTVANPGDVRVQVTVRDSGNVHRDLNPLGTPVVGRSSAGQRLIFSSATLLPGESGTVTATWHTPIACWCELVVAVPRGDGHVITVRRHVLVFPWAYAVAAILIIAGAAAVLPALGARRSRRP